jgi:hypothetical protein
MFQMHANSREQINEAYAGDIVALVGLKDTTTGDTLSDPQHRVVLERNPRYAKEPARVDRVEFRASLAASAIADGLRDGSLDIARDLLPQDLESILREPRFRAGLVETPKKNTYFAVFHTGSPVGSNAALRTALAGAVRTQDLVWGALGRFALPATGLIPPGILGHDAGRRQTHLSREQALEMIRSASLPSPVRLRVGIHPILLNQYAALTEALFRIWRDLGIEVEVATKTMPEFLESWHTNKGIDVMLGRWIADCDDPDNFTFTLFHSENGAARAYFSSRDRPHPRGGPRRGEAGRPRGALPEIRARPARPRDPGSPLPRRGLPDRQLPCSGPPASQHRALRELRRARKGGEGGGSGTRRPDGRRDPPRAHRRRRPEPRSGLCETLEHAKCHPALRDAHPPINRASRPGSPGCTRSDGKVPARRAWRGFHDGRG